jgi:hypothetical protein
MSFCKVFDLFLDELLHFTENAGNFHKVISKLKFVYILGIQSFKISINLTFLF